MTAWKTWKTRVNYLPATPVVTHLGFPGSQKAAPSDASHEAKDECACLASIREWGTHSPGESRCVTGPGTPPDSIPHLAAEGASL